VLGVFALDNLLIALAVLVIRSLVASLPTLAALDIGIAVAAGLYWLPPLRRASIAVVRRTRRPQSPRLARSAKPIASATGAVTPSWSDVAR
jgi:hypothetical protein